MEFELSGQKFVALNGGPQFTFNEVVSFQIPCSDQDEVEYHWSKLSDGGQEFACGWLKDQYGLCWPVIPTVLIDMISNLHPGSVKRATAAILTMTKFAISAAEGSRGRMNSPT